MAKSKVTAAEPWLKRRDWARGEVGSSERKGMLFAYGFSLVWYSFVLVLFGIFANEAKDHSKNLGAWLAFLFFMVGGLFPLGLGIRETLRYLKFGRSKFKMLSVPGAIGGELSGVVSIKTKIRPQDGFRITLRCVQYETTGNGKRSHTSQNILWEDGKTLRTEMLQTDQERTAIPVHFRIPNGCRSTSSKSDDRIIWTLEVSASVPGMDYSARYDVPIFKLPKVPESKINAQEFAAKFELPDAIPNAVAKAGILIAEEGRETRFVFKRGRNLEPTLFVLGFLVVCAVGSYFFWVQKGIFPEKIVASVGTVLSLIFLWGLGECLLKSHEVLTQVDGLRVRTNRGYSEKTVVIPKKDIQSIVAHSSLGLGETRYFEIRVRARANNPMGRQLVIAGSGIKGEKEAGWIVDRLHSALKLPKTHEAAENLQN